MICQKLRISVENLSPSKADAVLFLSFFSNLPRKRFTKFFLIIKSITQHKMFIVSKKQSYISISLNSFVYTVVSWVAWYKQDNTKYYVASSKTRTTGPLRPLGPLSTKDEKDPKNQRVVTTRKYNTNVVKLVSKRLCIVNFLSSIP